MYGTAEIAQALGISKQAVANHLSRGSMPAPDARLAMGPVWLADTIEPWIKERRITMINAECDICSAEGIETPATRKALGRHLCDECAAEYETHLKEGERIEDMTQEEINKRIYS